MKAAVTALWATSLLIVTTVLVVAVWHPTKAVVSLTIVNIMVVTACTVVASWARSEGRRA